MSKLRSFDSSLLVKLGLSQIEAETYRILHEEGSLSVKQAAGKLNVLPNALYRVFDGLSEKGLVISSGKYPATYKPLSASIALDMFIKNKIRDLETTKEEIVSSFNNVKSSDQTRIDIIKTTGEFFTAYVQLAKQAREEILIISIGEDVPDEVLLANRDALKKGISIRFIVHKYDKTNHDVLIRWQKMGLKVKYYQDWGFHLVIVDGVKSLLAVNNPDNTNERLAMKIYSRGLSNAYADYFNSIWERSEEIK